MQFIRLLMSYLKLHVFDLIVIFTVVLLLRTFSNLVSLMVADSKGVGAIVITTVSFVLVVLQLYTILSVRRFAWIVSGSLVVIVYFTSVGTFGYLFEVTFRPIIHDGQVYGYLMGGWLVLTESLKTWWLVRNQG